MGFFGRLFRNEGEQQAHQVVERLASDNQYVLFQDFDHKALSNFEHFYSKGNVDALANGGTKHIFLELQKEEDGLLKKLQSGEINKEQFLGDIEKLGGMNKHLSASENKKMANDLADMSLHAKEKGIGVHAVMDNTASRYDNLLDYVKDIDSKAKLNDFDSHSLESIFNEKIKNHEPDADKAKSALSALNEMKVDKNAPLDNKEFIEAYRKGFGDDRVAGDKYVADQIKKISGGEKSAIMYGADHGSAKDGSNGKDLDEHLGKSTAKIGLTPNKGQIIETQVKYNQTSELPATVIETNSNGIMPGHPVKVLQNAGKAPGGEVNIAQESSEQYIGKLKGFDVGSFQKSVGGQQQVRDDGREVGEAAQVNPGVEKQGHQQAKAQEAAQASGK
jgi:hypothetical protein